MQETGGKTAKQAKQPVLFCDMFLEMFFETCFIKTHAKYLAIITK
jgi:hypothetical protein